MNALRVVLGLALVGAACSPALAASTLWLDSESGDSLGLGQSYRLDASNGTLHVGSNTLEFRIHHQGASGQPSWTFVFLPPALERINVDTYADADAFHARRGRQPGIYIESGTAVSCATAPGQFAIHELVRAPDGAVQSAALDFVLHCDGATPAFRGYLRHNSSLPKVLPRPTAIAGADVFVEEGVSVPLRAQGLAGDSPLSTYAWRQVAGPTATRLSETADTALFVAPETSGAGVTLVFELEARDTAGRVDTDTVAMHVHDRTGPATLVVIDGAAEYISQGIDATYTRQDSSLRALPFGAQFLSGEPTDNGVVIDVVSDDFTGWNMHFFAPASQPLSVQTYTGATHFTGPSTPSMDVTYTGRGCNVLAGRFDVREIAMDIVAGTVDRLALDFEQYCDGAALPVRGHVRINSTVPLTRDAPIAVAGQDQIVAASSAVQLDGSGSHSTVSTINAWRWRQISGPSVTLSGTTSPAASFVAPALATGSAALEFELEVTSANGFTDTDLVTITVLSGAAPRNAFQFWSPPQEPIGGGINDLYDDVDGDFEFWPVDQTDDLQARFAGVVAGRSITWYFRFTAPGDAVLVPGSYENAQRWPFNSPLAPGLDVSGGLTNTGCNALEGRFVVLELVRNPATGQPVSAAVDFSLRCLERQNLPFFRGALRLNSSVPTERQAPEAAAGADQQVLEREAVLLDGSRSIPGQSAITAWTWRQIAGPSVQVRNADTANASFDAPATASSVALELELSVRSANGTTSTDRVRIDVRSKREPRTHVFIDGAPGAFVGNGYDHMLRPQDGLLTAELRAQDLALEISWVGTELWMLHFSPGAGIRPDVGRYTNAGRYFFGTTAGITMDVSGQGNGCNRLTGSFVIHELTFDPTGAVDQLALDFEQFCENQSVPTRGEVRIRTLLPDSFAGADRTASAGARVTLDGGGSAATLGTLSDLTWRQISGPPVMLSATGGASVEFTAPTLTAGASDEVLVFELEVTDSRALHDRDRMAVTIRAPTAAPAPPPTAPNPPAQAGGGSGGGGATDWLVILALLVAWTCSGTSEQSRQQTRLQP